MGNDILKVSQNGQILEVILDRPKANAIDAATSRMMGELFCQSFAKTPTLSGGDGDAAHRAAYGSG